MEESKMRMLKKLLLAGALAGMLGSFGFAQEAKAAAPSVTLTIDGDKATFAVESLSGNKLAYSVDDVSIGSVAITPGSTQTQTINSIKVAVNENAGSFTATSLSKLKGDLLSGNSVKEATASADLKDGGLYRIEVVKNSYGTVSLDGSTSNLVAYDYTTGSNAGTHTIEATAASGYKFVEWADGNTSAKRTDIVAKTTVASNKYEAIFEPIAAPVLKAKIGSTTYSSDTTGEIYMAIGETVTFSAAKPSGATGVGLVVDPDMGTYFKKVKSGVYEAKKATEEDVPVSVCARATFADGTTSDSGYIDFYVEGSAASGRVNLSDFKDYITEGYTLEFKAKPDEGSFSSMSVDISDGKDYVDGDVKVEKNSSDNNATIKIKFKDEKLEKGNNSAKVKFKIKVDGETASIDSDTATEKEITVYSNPTNSYASDRTMSYKVPAKVNTGNESGKDSNLSYTQDTVSEVKGIRLNVLLNDTILGTTTTAAGKGTSATVEASTMESIVTNLGNSGKFTGDCTITLRAYPSDSSGNCNKKVYHDTYAKVYKVVLRPGATATAGSKTASAYALPLAMIATRSTTATTTTTAAGKEYVLYGLEGQTLTAPSDATNILDSTGAAVTKIVVSSDPARNVYTYTASKSSADGLDKVPKTGQSNVFVYVMAVIVCGAVAYGLYVYNKKSKKSI